MSAPYVIASAMEKFSNVDSDIRFMALSDLNNELQKDNYVFDEPTERKACLTPLVRKVREQQLLEIVEQLCNLLAQKKEELRDISALGLKTVIVEINAASSIAKSIVTRLVPKLLILLNDLDDVQLEVIDILSELLLRFGQVLYSSPDSTSSQARQIQQVLVTLLDHVRPAVRKRATSALGNLVINNNDDLFNSLVVKLNSEMVNKASSGDFCKLRTLIAAIATISSRRLGKSLHVLLPLIMEYTAFDDDELREICLQAFECFVLRCPTEITPSIATLTTTALKFLKYDPNYEDIEGGDQEMDMDCDEGGVEDEMDAEDAIDEEYDEDEEDYSDADDMSWKVRRGSAKLLSSIIGTRAELLSSLFSEVAPQLISRFKEREESVRTEILATFIALIRQVGNATSGRLKEQWNKSSTALSDPRYQLQQEMPRLCKSLARQISGKSASTRQIGFVLLRELILVLDGGLDLRIALFVPAVESSLAPLTGKAADKFANNPNLKIDVLQFLRVLFGTHNASAFENHLERLVPPVVAAAKDKFYKISSEALLVLAELVKIIRPLPPQTRQRDIDPPTYQHSVKVQIMLLYETIQERLKTSDIDLEVKERSIIALGTLISQAGDVIETSQIQTVAVPILIERLRNELTRLVTLRVLRSIAESPILKSFARDSLVPPPVASEIASFLRKSHRQLRSAALSCLDVLIGEYGSSWPSSILQDILNEVKPLLVETDLNIFSLAMNVIVAILNVDNSGACLESVRLEVVKPLARIILESPHLVAAGSGLDAVLSFWRCIIDRGGFGVFTEILKILTDPLSNASTRISRQSFRPLAQSIASLTQQLKDDSEKSSVLKDFISTVADSKTADDSVLLALLTIGEVGRVNDFYNLSPELHVKLLEMFTNPSDEIKQAAAFCLGNIALGNMSQYLPPIFDAVKSSGKRRYLVLVSLKEIIARSGPSSPSATQLFAYSGDLWSLLFLNTEESLEEGTRAIIEECLGKLALSRPKDFLPDLRAKLSSPSAVVRATAVAAIRYTFTECESEEFDSLLGQMMVEFLRLMKDDDLNVRRVSLLTFNSATHNKPYLVLRSLDELLPYLYNETAINRNYVREVMMGPFKEYVDDGLDARKSAYECMFTLLETTLSHIDLFVFLDHVVQGLSDSCQEIKTLCHLMLQRLAVLAPNALVSRLDLTIAPLKATINSKPKNNAVKQELEKFNDLVRSAVRTAVILGRIFSGQQGGGGAGSVNGGGIAASVVGGSVSAGLDASVAGKFDEFLKECRAPASGVADIFVAVQSELEAQNAMGLGRGAFGGGGLGPMDLS